MPGTHLSKAVRTTGHMYAVGFTWKQLQRATKPVEKAASGGRAVEVHSLRRSHACHVTIWHPPMAGVLKDEGHQDIWPVYPLRPVFAACQVRLHVLQPTL
jgi:hypothetical protein